jgi:hypothetical protein
MDTVQTQSAPVTSTSLTDAFSDSEDLFDVLGAHDSSDEEKAALLVQMIEIVQTRVFDKIFDIFNQDQRDQLVELMENEELEKTEEFLQVNVPDYYDRFELEAKQLRRELITRMAA